MRSRTIQGPVLDDAPVGRQGRSLWKRVLPEGQIVYKASDGKKHYIDMNKKYHDDLIASYGQQALDTTPFMLADRDNAHTMDPERWRGNVVATKFARSGDELEPGVKADMPGLYTKVTFDSRRTARLAERSGLGVSARIREGVEDANGRTFPRAMIHVLGTFDPKITGLGAWKPAMDLSNYAQSDVLDLSRAEIRMPKLGRRNRAGRGGGDLDFATMTADDIAALDPNDVEGWTDAQLADFTARVAELTGGDVDDLDDDGDEADDDDTDADDALDDDDPELDDDDDPDDKPKGRTKKDTQMSNRSRRGGSHTQIDLAVTRSQQASDVASEALRRAAAAEWAATRTRLLHKGVPPAALDLAQPVLGRIEDAVNIDFSNTSTGGEKVDVLAIVNGLVEMMEGTIEFGEKGMDFSNDDDTDNPDAVLHAEFDKRFAHLGI